MSLWRIIKDAVNGEHEMKMFYDRKSLYEIRVKYAEWIEDRLTNITTNHVYTEKDSAQFLKDLEEHIGYFTTKNEFCIMCNPIRRFKPIDLLTHLRDGINNEILLINELTSSKQKNQLESIQELLKSCNESYEILNEQKTETDKEFNESYVAEGFVIKILQDYKAHQLSVFDELKNWERKQIGINHMDAEVKIKMNQIQIDKLNKIQIYFEQLLAINTMLLSLVEYLKKQTPRSVNKMLEYLAIEIKKHQEDLINSSFIVDNQPKQVIKMNQRFSSSVRWLLGPKLGLNNVYSNVQCVIVTDEKDNNKELQTADSKHLHHSPRSFSCDEVKFEYQENNRIYFAKFESLQLNFNYLQKRLRDRSVRIMDRKLSLLFRMVVKTENSKYIITKLSTPVVVIDHPIQETQAFASILWYNAFSGDGYDLNFPDRISWTKLADALNLKCFSETKRGFTDANRRYLYKKIHPNITVSQREEDISRNTFCKEILQGCAFTFWEWFYYIIKLINEHLLKPWQANLIEGFISRNDAEKILRYCRPGTFLLRFSDTIMGAITISYVYYDYQVLHIQPFTRHDLRAQCLSDRIKECMNISELYPYKIDKSYFENEF